MAVRQRMLPDMATTSKNHVSSNDGFLNAIFSGCIGRDAIEEKPTTSNEEDV